MQTSYSQIDQLVGQTLGSYTITRLLGHGRANAIYLAKQMTNDQTVMLTVFAVPEGYSPQVQQRFSERFHKQARILVLLRHPHILPTYDFGEHDGGSGGRYFYLVTPFVTAGSLAKELKKRGRYTPEQALDVVRQIAEGLDYAHSQRMVHGALQAVNILPGENGALQIAGFGLTRMLALRGLLAARHPSAHLVSMAGKFLGSPESIAPEVVQGGEIDERADIYGLGILLYELLSGSPPYQGDDPFEVAHMHVQQPLPSLVERVPELSPGVVMVVEKALEKNALQRYQTAGKLVAALERVVVILQANPSSLSAAMKVVVPVKNSALTMPPDVNWFEEELAASPKKEASKDSTGRQPAAPAGGNGASDGKADPFTWWSTGTLPAPAGPQAGMLSPVQPTSQAKKTEKPGRRRVIATIATSAVVVGLVGAGAVTLAQVLQKRTVTGGSQPSNTNVVVTTTGTSTINGVTTPAPNTKSTPPGQVVQSTRTPGKQGPGPTATSGAQPTQGATQPQPTAGSKPKPTQPPPPPASTVIGKTSQEKNSAVEFTNAKTGNAGLLVRLANGNFVAFESACTHAGVPVYYDNTDQNLRCPLHGALFDPAQEGMVTKGPATEPLPMVSIKINGDGTITLA